MKAWVYCSKGGSDVVRSKNHACMLHMQQGIQDMHTSTLQFAFLHYPSVRRVHFSIIAWSYYMHGCMLKLQYLGILSCPTTRMRAILIMCVAPHMSICMPSCTWLCVIHPMVFFVTAFLILYTSLSFPHAASLTTHALIQIVLVERRKQRWRRWGRFPDALVDIPG